MLSVRDIAKSRYDKVMSNHEHYKSILQDILFQIKEVNDSTSSQNYLVYELPWLTCTHSLYDVNHAKTYIGKRLQKLGYRVEVMRDKVRVDWSVANDLVRARIEHKHNPARTKKPHPDAWRFA